MDLAPRTAHDAAAPAVAGLADDRRRDLGLRIDRWWGDLVSGLEVLYPDRAEALATDLVARAAAAYAERGEELHTLDARRLLRPDWLQQPDMVGYACYAERFAGTLEEVGTRAGYLRELGVTYLHLMPLLLPREGDSDGGYAVADYRTVRPDLGTTEDLRRLTGALREQGISLVIDLVLNHVAKEHEWARRAAAGERRYRDYFHIFPDRREPDAYEATLPEVFPDFAPGSFTWDDEVGGWVWTTFNAWQWDLDWSNPQVLLEFADIVLFLANLGVEVLRLDAIAFTWKRLGTTCQNQPEVHALTQVLRTVARIAAPALAFKAEAIVGPRDLVPYLGSGPHTGKVSDLAYHNSLMVQAWNVLATGDVRLARHALSHLPPTPPSGTWITYLRCHDDIGWAIDDGDAAAVGLDGWLHRRFLADWYAGDLDGSWGDGLLFQVNPQTGDKRTSGTAASLAGAVPEHGRDGSGKGLARLFLGYALVYGWGGIPVVWSGDELAMPNDPGWAAEPGHGADNRWAHRPRLDWSRAETRGDIGTIAGAMFQALAHLGRVRASLPQLHAVARVRVLDDTDDGILAVARTHPAGPFVGLYNVTDEWRPFPIHRLREEGIGRPVNALSGHDVTTGEDGLVWLSPYAAWWVVDGG